jgi:hypothetical protein
MGEQEATPSNCGKPLKPLIPNQPGNGLAAKRNKLGYGKKSKDITMGNPQPSPKAQSAMDAVQRLNVGGPQQMLRHKIKSVPMETWLGGGIHICCIQMWRRVSRDLEGRSERMLAYSN